MKYAGALVIAALISWLLTPAVRRLAITTGALDRPDGDRKRHSGAIPRLGGLAIAAAFVVTVLIFVPITRPLVGLLAGTVVVVAVGAIDDRHSLSPWVKLGWQLVAAGLALAGGIGISAISKPFGGAQALDLGRFNVNLGWLHFHVTPLANALSIIWIVGLVNAVNFLDGIDGLATGVSGIASFFLFLLALKVHQPAVALLAITLTGASLGFLRFNFFPATIFLGDSGAYFLGLILALLAIYSGGKLATAVLVLGFAVIDGLITVLRRLLRRGSPFRADRSHLHHLLIDFGLSQRQTVMLYYVLAVTLGLIALASGTLVKIAAIAVLGVVTVLGGAILIRLAERTTQKSR